MEPDLVLVGMVVGLDYKNPYLNPYKEFQVVCIMVYFVRYSFNNKYDMMSNGEALEASPSSGEALGRG